MNITGIGTSLGSNCEEGSFSIFIIFIFVFFHFRKVSFSFFRIPLNPLLSIKYRYLAASAI